MLKLGTVSPDLLIKLALVAGAIGLAWYAYKQASGAAGQTLRDLKDSAAQVADEVIADFSSAFNNNIAAPFARGQAYARSGFEGLPTEKEFSMEMQATVALTRRPACLWRLASGTQTRRRCATKTNSAPPVRCRHTPA